ncbi:MAG: Peptidyl-prolyl cis-trans isomerase-like 4, variant 2 [Marteilia pararefringens]
MKYYNWCLFHKIVPNFVAQTGDPDDNGKGGTSVYIHDPEKQSATFSMEFHPKIKHKIPGLISMVNNGKNMFASQFILTLGPSCTNLDRKCSAFGRIVEGLEIIGKFNDTACNKENRPLKDIRITHTIVVEDPFEDFDWLKYPSRSPSPPRNCYNSDYININEEIDESKGDLEIKKEIEDQESRTNAKILEIIGDLPHAEIKPDDNVLFVCKLNPVTVEEDLELIFSRFGEIKLCEIIRDRYTGESLQYGFIEFVRKEDCEAAIFKMDNVLIDDRRIQVDFSQSVSKKMDYKIVRKSKHQQIKEGKKSGKEYKLV